MSGPNVAALEARHRSEAGPTPRPSMRTDLCAAGKGIADEVTGPGGRLAGADHVLRVAR